MERCDDHASGRRVEAEFGVRVEEWLGHERENGSEQRFHIIAGEERWARHMENKGE